VARIAYFLVYVSLLAAWSLYFVSQNLGLYNLDYGQIARPRNSFRNLAAKIEKLFS